MKYPRPLIARTQLSRFTLKRYLFGLAAAKRLDRSVSYGRFCLIQNSYSSNSKCNSNALPLHKDKEASVNFINCHFPTSLLEQSIKNTRSKTHRLPLRVQRFLLKVFEFSSIFNRSKQFPYAQYRQTDKHDCGNNSQYHVSWIEVRLAN